ncbi:uncharacterized protein METZ01_LOCUS151366 [marine metagenome]|uniref:Uncharacterized protein n=1 Tax=marine metagenome TaxID=408172 RepID=A0A382ABQ0_9ZZZZ
MNPILLVCIVLAVAVSKDQVVEWYDDYMILYEEANNKVEEEENSQGLIFTKIDDKLYTLMGTVKEGDCEKIAPDMPPAFTVILESPGGNLKDGSCIAAHIKLRDVVTVVRDSIVLNELGETIYEPGSNLDIDENTPDYMRGKSICASACGLMFLAGDKRYLMGEVYFGIHGPGTPPGSMNGASPAAIESSAFRTASSLMKLLKSLGVEDEGLRLLFIQIPNATMYWLHPRDFEVRPALITIATDYRDFFGTTGSDLEGGLR